MQKCVLNEASYSLRKRMGFLASQGQDRTCPTGWRSHSLHPRLLRHTRPLRKQGGKHNNSTISSLGRYLLSAAFPHHCSALLPGLECSRAGGSKSADLSRATAGGSRARLCAPAGRFASMLSGGGTEPLWASLPLHTPEHRNI